ncbi:FAD-dependent oxidoreductase [Streptomyces sp. NBC_00147]
MTKRLTCVVVVVGAGMTGAACALYAARASLNVALVDRGPVAGGTTGAGEGNLQAPTRGRADAVPGTQGRNVTAGKAGDGPSSRCPRWWRRCSSKNASGYACWILTAWSGSRVPITSWSCCPLHPYSFATCGNSASLSPYEMWTAPWAWMFSRQPRRCDQNAAASVSVARVNAADIIMNGRSR